MLVHFQLLRPLDNEQVSDPVEHPTCHGRLIHAVEHLYVNAFGTQQLAQHEERNCHGGSRRDKQVRTLLPQHLPGKNSVLQ